MYSWQIFLIILEASHSNLISLILIWTLWLISVEDVLVVVGDTCRKHSCLFCGAFFGALEPPSLFWFVLMESAVWRKWLWFLWCVYFVNTALPLLRSVIYAVFVGCFMSSIAKAGRLIALFIGVFIYCLVRTCWLKSRFNIFLFAVCPGFQRMSQWLTHAFVILEVPYFLADNVPF